MQQPALEFPEGDEAKAKRKVPLSLPRFIPRLARAWADSKGIPNKRKTFKGLTLEFALLSALVKLGFLAYAAPSPQAWLRRRGKSPDAILALRGSSVFFECKNWNPGFKISAEVVKDEILSRFPGVPTRVLVISSTRRWTPEAKRLLKERGILVLDLGFAVSPRNLGKALAMLEHKLSLLFHLMRNHGAEFFEYNRRRPSLFPRTHPLSRVVASGMRLPSGERTVGPPILAVVGTSAKRPVGSFGFLILTRMVKEFKVMTEMQTWTRRA
jgi:hypothetical protein